MASYYKYSASMNDRTYFTSVVTTTAGNIKRYFSNVESEVYFGDKEMEDIYQFQFSIDEKVLPVYGYNCYHASELVSGQRIIQGQFILNYTNEQEIKTTLGEIDSSVYESILADEYHPSGGSISDPIYNKLFDIMIGYGYYNVKDKQTYNATCQTIVGCKISGMQKVIDSTGQPIMEVYNFVAMDFIEENIVESEQAAENPNNKNNNNTQNTEAPVPALYSNSNDMYAISVHGPQSERIGCPHLICDIVLIDSADYIFIQITEDTNDYEITILDGTLRIDENMTEYTNEVLQSELLPFESISANTANVKLTRDQSVAIKKAVDDSVDGVTCELIFHAELKGKTETIKRKEPYTFDLGKIYN